MNSMLISLAVAGVFIVTGAVLGFRLAGRGKPYNAAVLIVHIIITLLIAAGLVASIFKVRGISAGKVYFLVSLHLGMLAIMVNIVTGVILARVKKETPKLVLTHKLATLVMILSILTSAVFTFIKF